LSQFKLGSEGSVALASWLSVPNALARLILSDTQANTSVIAEALCKGSAASLQELDLSHNKFGKGVTVTDLTALFSTCTRLRRVSLAFTLPSTEQLRDIIRALSGNSELEQLDLDLSGNALGVVGANLLALELKQFVSLAVLHVADNAFKDKGLAILCDALSENDRLAKLDLSDNFDFVAFRKSKLASSLFAEALGNLVASDKCRITHLKLRSTQKATQMKGELSPILVDLGENGSVCELDLTGQSLEYQGFVGLTKMLQLNRSVRTLFIDDNGIDFQCLRSLLQALSRNKTLQLLPLPVNDFAALLSKADLASRREFQTIWSAIERILLENSISGSSSSSQQQQRRERTVGLSRDSNVKIASTLFDRNTEMETLRFAIRVGSNQKLAAESKVRKFQCLSLFFF